MICTLREKITPCACLVGSGLKFIFHWNAHSPIFSKSSFRSIFEASTFLIREKSEVSSANNLGFDAKFSDKSLISIKNNSSPRIEPLGTPALALAHQE